TQYLICIILHPTSVPIAAQPRPNRQHSTTSIPQKSMGQKPIRYQSRSTACWHTSTAVPLASSVAGTPCSLRATNPYSTALFSVSTYATPTSAHTSQDQRHPFA